MRPGARFALFGECLLVGVLVAVAILPVVTLLPALAAGCAHIRAHVDGETTTVSAFFGRLRAAWRENVPLCLGAAGGVALLALDLVVVVRAAPPGAGPVAAVCVAVAAGSAVVLLRAAAVWRPGSGWAALVRAAAHRSVVGDPSGSLLLVLALGLLALLTWQLLPLAVPMLGCLLMAAVAVERRGAAAPV